MNYACPDLINILTTGEASANKNCLGKGAVHQTTHDQRIPNMHLEHACWLVARVLANNTVETEVEKVKTTSRRTAIEESAVRAKVTA